MTVTISEAQKDLPQLLARLKTGEEEVIIEEGGKPVARLLPVAEKSNGTPGSPAKRVPGYDAGKVWMAPDFDAPLPEDILRSFEGEE